MAPVAGRHVTERRMTGRSGRGAVAQCEPLTHYGVDERLFLGDRLTAGLRRDFAHWNLIRPVHSGNRGSPPRFLVPESEPRPDDTGPGRLRLDRRPSTYRRAAADCGL